MKEELEKVSRMIDAIELQYADADINEKLTLKAARNAAYSEYARLQAASLQAVRQLTEADRSEMAAIEASISDKADKQAVAAAGLRLAKLLKTFV